MLSYRHAFHAGNHADVLKHFVLIQLSRYLGQKDKPFWIIDTHAGAGLYALDTGYATQLKEYESGIGKLWTRQDLPAALADYVDLVRACNPKATHDATRCVFIPVLPGSPCKPCVRRTACACSNSTAATAKSCRTTSRIRADA